MAQVVDKDEIARQNRLAVRYFAVAGIPVSIANVFAQSIVQGVPALTAKNLVLLAYFLVLFAADRLLIPKRCSNSTLLAYLAVAPVMTISILLGTVWDPTHQAITFPMFMAVIPIFILDSLPRVVGVSFGWNVVFMVCVLAFKDPSLYQNDLIHATEFFFMSVAVTFIVLRLRFEVIQNLDRANYHLEHDLLTDTQNRLCLMTQMDDYLNHTVSIAICSLDHLSLITDFYGTDVSDEVVDVFSKTLKKLFGNNYTYLYGTNEFLCIAIDGTHREAPELARTCQQLIESAKFDGMSAKVSCSFGIVTGIPKTSAEFTSMIQLATIYAHQAQDEGEGKSISGTFDEEALHNGIVQSHLGIHAQSYEINQLTGLPTVPYFVIRCEEGLHHVVDLSRRPVIGFLNINHFRAYNEQHGYTKGDELIVELSHSLSEAFSDRYIAYITGSQFCLMCYMDEVENGMALLTQRIEAFASDESLAIRAGFVEYSQGDSVNALLDKARTTRRYVSDDNALRYRIYDEELDEKLRLNQYVVSHLTQALNEGWLQVYYQPIMWSSGHKLCNMEALSRWIDPVYGTLSPAQFIPALERERLIYKLSLHVIRQAIHDLKKMEEMGLPRVPISINLSRNDFFACDMVEEISAMVREAEIPPCNICIEITESAVAQSQELLHHEVERFHEQGFSVWMDDFGSEYSTLNILEELDFNLVKLDMRFMHNFVPSSRNAIIVSSVIDMCSRLGMETLVEGVETEEHAISLKCMGSDKLQGYLYSRPLPFEEVVNLIKANGWL